MAELVKEMQEIINKSCGLVVILRSQIPNEVVIINCLFSASVPFKFKGIFMVPSG